MKELTWEKAIERLEKLSIVTTSYFNRAIDNFAIPAIKKVAMIEKENPTNGDMIKTMFPNIEVKEWKHTVDVAIKDEPNTFHVFQKDWWNAPFKIMRGDKE